MLARIGAAFGLALADDISLFAAACAHSARIVAIPKMWQLDSAHGNADQVLALLADQLALREKFPQVVTDSPLDDLSKTLVIFFNFQDHFIRPTFPSSRSG